MARPQSYDDSKLLMIMAELLAHSKITKVTQVTAAARNAVNYIFGSDNWPEHTRKQTIDRLLKAWSDREAEIKTAAAQRQRPFWGGPLLPSLLDLPEHPTKALCQSLAPKLRNLARWANQWASEMENSPEGAAHSKAEIAQKVLRAVEGALGISNKKNPPG